MKRLAYALSTVAILTVAAPMMTKAHGVHHGHAGKIYRGHSVACHDVRPPAPRYGYDRVAPGEWNSLEYEDRDRGLYMGQRHDD